MNLYEDLKWRGLIKDESNPQKIEELLNGEPIKFYWGTDPSADSLHLGHLSSLLLAKRLGDAGHHPILLVGGATGLIGDPKPTTERAMISKKTLDYNYECIKNQIFNLFGYEMVNNYDWSKEINFIEFLRDYGKFFPVNYMLDKDIIKRRLETGITYTEFSYMIMQALDFEYLYKNKDVILQVEGSDQWGNITSGIELIKKKHGKEAYGFTMPLILDKSGNKFGKSEGNALWLDKEKTSSYDLYQYLVNSDDSIVIHYLKVLTFLEKSEIESLEEKLKTKPELREAQKALAYEVVKFLHGKEESLKARQMSEDAFSGNNTDSLPETSLDKNLLTSNFTICDLLVQTNICSSKSDARRLVEQGGISINSSKQTDSKLLIDNKLFQNNELIIHKGKKNIYKIVLK